MSLNNYLKKGLKQSEVRTKHCVAIGKDGEALFRELTGAIKSDLPDDKKHIDFYWEGKNIDVKGLKPMHNYGFILLEFINSWGHHGWCSKESKAEYIAFQFPNQFYIFKKDDLRARAIEKCDKYSPDVVIRKNKVKPSQGLYKWIGRFRWQDVFTYLRIEDVMDLLVQEIKY